MHEKVYSTSPCHMLHTLQNTEKNRNCIVPNSTAVAGRAGKVHQMEAMSFPKRKHTEKAAKSNENTHTRARIRKNILGNHFLLTAKSTKRFFDFTLFVLLSIVCRSECHFTKAIKPPNQRVEIGDIRSTDAEWLNQFKPNQLQLQDWL